MQQDIMVSVVCNAYNHGKYIAQALESFVMQQTNFPFEVLVHDDASKDHTADIIREYAQKYPDIIKPYYQTENQYSQHIPITRKYQYSRAQGKYIAFCEGDDYWTDPLKLQKQVNAMEQHPEADICSHRAVTDRDGKLGKCYPDVRKDCVLPVEQVIDGGGAFVATNSLLIRKSFIDSPFDYTNCYNLDYILQVSGSLRGGMVFVSDSMAAYRVNAEGSWTVKHKRDAAWLSNHRSRIRDILEQMDQDTDHAYTVSIKRYNYLNMLKQIAAEGGLCKLFAKEQKEAMSAQPLKMRILLVGLATLRCLGRHKSK